MAAGPRELGLTELTDHREIYDILLGYALRGNRVLVTAEEGTKLPFDQEMIPCHFWRPGDTVADRKRALVEFWEKNINRPQIVKTE